MTIKAKLGLGTTLHQGVTKVGVLTNVGMPEQSVDTIEVTTLDDLDGYKKELATFKTGGEIPITGYYDSSDAGQAALLTSFQSGSEEDYTITLPSTFGSVSYTFTGIVTKYKAGGEANVKDALGFEATIKVVGAPTLNVSASGGLTAMTLTGTAGSLSPAFNNAKYNYAYTFTTDASITVTPTGASHSIDVYVDDVYIETVSTGSASAAIAIANGASKKITLVAYETGKTAKTYNIIAARTA